MIRPTDITIRPEDPSDQNAIYVVTKLAFADMPFAGGDEQDLINALRNMGVLSLSLVAEYGDKVVGHLALSPVEHESGEKGWFGLGPISVHPDLQKMGIGGLLIAEAVEWMTARQARGCILTGDPNYYSRHGFVLAPAHTPEREPPEYFMILDLAGAATVGRFSFHRAFYG